MSKLDTLIGVAAAMGVVVIIVWGIGWLFSLGPDTLTNEQIIEETKKCNDAGLEADRYVSGHSLSPQ